MKTKCRSRSLPLWLFFALAISVVVVATSIAPSDAAARPRPENTQPFAGDPDTPEGPHSGLAKGPSLSRVSGPNEANYTTAIRGFSALQFYGRLLVGSMTWLRMRGF